MFHVTMSQSGRTCQVSLIGLQERAIDRHHHRFIIIGTTFHLWNEVIPSPSCQPHREQSNLPEITNQITNDLHAEDDLPGTVMTPRYCCPSILLSSIHLLQVKLETNLPRR